MDILSKRRRATLASLGFGCAAIATLAGCGASDSVAPKAPRLLLIGSWQYNGLEPVGFGSAFNGLVFIDSLKDSTFSGAFEGQIADSAGVPAQATAAITGRQTDTTSVTFSFVTPDGDTIVNTGSLDVDTDTLRGDWLNRRQVKAGTFTMVHGGKADDPSGPKVQSRRPPLP